MNIVSIMLEEIKNHIGMEKMRIRTTDLSKRSYNYKEEEIYANYVNSLVKKIGRCTQDSVRKNLFVDLNRMGLIERFDKYGTMIGLNERKAVYYIALSKLGLEFVNNIDKVFQKTLLYSKAIDRLTNGLANELLDIVSMNGCITIYEFMYFISFIGLELNGHTYTRTELVDLLKEYRSLSNIQKKAINDIISNYCNPQKFAGNKKNKRDFHNWKNESQQIFMLMNQTVFYELVKDKLIIRIGNSGLYLDDVKLKRSIAEKHKYFEKHKINKQVGFELHHIVPLLTARDRNEFLALDVWENMLYIDGYTHAKITHTNNKNTRLFFESEDIILKDSSKILEDIKCKKSENVLYDSSNKDVMLKYNNNIINSL
ncbi:MAG: restriction endonuclease subunit R [Bacilli bacterium]|nr:restriction endonuclease subunit R [Bacilli bacterium]